MAPGTRWIGWLNRVGWKTDAHPPVQPIFLGYSPLYRVGSWRTGIILVWRCDFLKSFIRILKSIWNPSEIHNCRSESFFILVRFSDWSTFWSVPHYPVRALAIPFPTLFSKIWNRSIRPNGLWGKWSQLYQAHWDVWFMNALNTQWPGHFLQCGAPTFGLPLAPASMFLVSLH
jgi:hypothetical protein